MNDRTLITAPATIGILGGGQLGAMLCEAGRRLGYRVIVLSENLDDPAAGWADEHVQGDTGDAAAVTALARRCDVLTNEFEQVQPDVLEAAEQIPTCRVAPSSRVQATCRDRREEKKLFARGGFPHGPFAPANAEAELLPAYQQLSNGGQTAVVAKTARGGYDGKGQAWLRSEADARAIWKAMDGEPLLLEQAVPFVAEASVIVARSPGGETRSFPMFRNEHRNGILHQTVIPAGFGADTEAAARRHATGIAEQLGVVGLLAVEMFVLADGRVWMNELAARPHNSGHVTLRATARSQFELHIAAICNLPLGNGGVVADAGVESHVALLQPAVMTNLLGDLWLPDRADGPREPDWPRVFADPRATLHLYGKSPRPGRKMGHMIHTAETVEAALAAARALFGMLSRSPTEPAPR